MKTGLKIVAVCFTFGVCFGIGGALAGVAKLVPIQATAQAASSDSLLPFVVFCLSVGSAVSFLVLRSYWHGLKLAGVLFGATYGISTIASQVESLFFLSAKMPSGLIRALFVQGAIAMALFSPLAVLILGKWRRPQAAVGKLEEPRVAAATMTRRIALLVVAFVFLYLFFGYYVAWQNPSLRRKTPQPTPCASLFAMKRGNKNTHTVPCLLVFLCRIGTLPVNIANTSALTTANPRVCGTELTASHGASQHRAKLTERLHRDSFREHRRNHESQEGWA